MTRSNAITVSRLGLAAAFAVLFLLPLRSQAAQAVIVPALWVVAILGELSDFFDGWTARRFGEVSDFGKVFDPFADVLFHLTAFACMAREGLLPIAFLLVVIAREQTISLVRLLAAKRGLIMGARPGGKAKTVSYVIVGGFVLARSNLARLGLLPWADEPLSIAVIVLCVGAAALSLASLADYVNQYRKLGS